MSLNAKFLHSFPLDEEAAGRILAAHREELDALTAERDAALIALREHEQTVAELDALREESAARQAEAEQLRSEMERFQQQVHKERTADGRRAALEAALTNAGANAHAVPLLAQTISTTEDDWDGTALRDAAATLTPVTNQYAAFFSQPEAIPTVRITPPLSANRALTQSDLRSMSAQDINRHWPQVRQALRVQD